MLINALCNFYDILAEQGEVLPPGYSKVNIHYKICLTPEGRIDDIIDCQIESTIKTGKGKEKTVYSPRIIKLMERTQKSSINSNTIEHRPLYIFGLNLTSAGLTPNDSTNKAKKSHEAFVRHNLEFIDGIDSPIVNAYRCFLTSWEPTAETENSRLLQLGKSYATAGYVFCLAGRPDLLLHEDEQIRARWEEQSAAANAPGDDDLIAQCAITGEAKPIARIHNKIKGVPGGNPTGTSLVSFKNPSESSYGQTQSYNSNISETAMRKYTEALNYLLANRRHKSTLDDLTVLHWAVDADRRYDDIFGAMTFSDHMDDEATSAYINQLLKDAREADFNADRLQAADNIDPKVSLYIVGVKPNAGRLALKFIYRQPFGKLLCNIARHQDDIKIKDSERPIPLWQIKRELVSPKASKDTVDPALMTKLLEAIINGRNYPDFLLATLVQRVKTDQNEENNRYIKLNDTRAGLIRGCINRRARLANQKEEITLALDKTNDNQAYLCGRLFAVLEATQLRSAGYNLNRTIADAYFASAASRPATIFPKLLKLSKAHQAKLKNPKYITDQIKEITDLMGGEYPVSLPLIEQGKFIIGYYHQQSDNDRMRKERQEEHRPID